MASAITRIIRRSQVGEVQQRQGARYVPMFNILQPYHILLFVRIAPISQPFHFQWVHHTDQRIGKMGR